MTRDEYILALVNTPIKYPLFKIISYPSHYNKKDKKKIKINDLVVYSPILSETESEFFMHLNTESDIDIEPNNLKFIGYKTKEELIKIKE